MQTETVEVPREAPPEFSAASVAPRPKPLPLERQSTSLLRLRVPDGWTLEADEQQKPGYVESRWRDPENSESSVLVDVIAGESLSPGEKAASVRASTSQTPGYRELSFGPVQLAGREAFRWEFEVSGDRRIDFFLNQCETGVAVLGSAAPSDFRALRGTFVSVARSVRVDCSGATPTAPPEPPPSDEFPEEEEEGCLSEYPDVCVPSDGFDYDCTELDVTDFSVPGDDPMGFDRDLDGVGCES